MTTTIAQWHARATWLLGQLEHSADDRPTRVQQARLTLAAWARLVEAVPSRALSAAAHQGLLETDAAAAVKERTVGLLMLSGPTGCGKSTAAAWKAYGTGGSTLWLNASEVALGDFKAIPKLCALIRDAGLVVLDDIGAGNSGAPWAAPKIHDILTAMLERRKPAICNTNMDREAFVAAYDAGKGHGRLMSRLAMPPHAWVDVRGQDRRPEATQPPDPEQLPEHEAQARVLLQGRDALERARQAAVAGDVESGRISEVAQLLGIASWDQLDRGVRESDRRMADVGKMFSTLTSSMRYTAPNPC